MFIYHRQKFNKKELSGAGGWNDKVSGDKVRFDEIRYRNYDLRPEANRRYIDRKRNDDRNCGGRQRIMFDGGLYNDDRRRTEENRREKM